MRATTAFKHLMRLPGITVTGVEFLSAKVVIDVTLRSGSLGCPLCSFATRARYDARPVASTWRHLDLAAWRLEVRANLRRLDCPTHGVRTQAVPFARIGSRFTSDFEDLAGWLATTMDKTAICRLLRIDWDTVGRIIERVMATGLDPNRLEGLFQIGVDEVSWRKGHRYTDVEFTDTKVVVDVTLRSGILRCPCCTFTTPARYDERPVASTWRHLDLGAWRLEVRASLCRLRCPTHGVRTRAVPFARVGSRFTTDMEDLVGWLATTMDKTAICRLVRIDWDTVGRIIERVMATGLDPNRLEGLFQIGVDEVSWRKGHKYITFVSDHTSRRFVWAKAGKDAATLDSFFDELGSEATKAITEISMDMGPAYAKSATERAPKAVLCYDPFHVVKLATDALDKVRRAAWQEMRALPDKDAAKKFKGARWALLKNPTDLTDKQAVTLRKLKRKGGELWRALKCPGFGGGSRASIQAGPVGSDWSHYSSILGSRDERRRLLPVPDGVAGWVLVSA